uniref:Sushi domain-containing protein n=1 Tax=Angiostrongylus cantonensis TaxID=6313 RepID=A0A0K0DQV2_ANGCA
MECKTEANVKAMLDTLEKSNKVKCNDTEGEERDSGVEWQDGSIQYKCDENGEVAFVGCLTSTGELIPLGETKSVDGDDVECKTDATGKPVLEAVEKPMEAKCKDSRGRERDLGSEWTVGWFHFKCAEDGKVEFIGCFTSSGEIILRGERRTEDGRDLECKVDEKGSPFLNDLGKSSLTKCKDGEGKYRIQGEEWVEKNFQKVCRERGRVEVLGCRVEDVDELIPLNGKVSAGKYDHYCKEKDGGHLYYKTPKET